MPGKQVSPPLVLASRSPRRRMLLQEHGLNHETMALDVDDADLAPGQVSPSAWAAALAFFKAAAGAERWRRTHPDDPRIVLGADTICVQEGRIIGQPSDERDAARILRDFESRSHEVITGLALVESHGTNRWILCDRAVVTVRRLGDARISEYVASGLWRGKAGGYNLEERLAAGWPITYEGDADSIVGLPVRLVRSLLARWPLAPPERAAAPRPPGGIGKTV